MAKKEEIIDVSTNELLEDIERREKAVSQREQEVSRLEEIKKALENDYHNILNWISFNKKL